MAKYQVQAAKSQLAGWHMVVHYVKHACTRHSMHPSQFPNLCRNVVASQTVVPKRDRNCTVGRVMQAQVLYLSKEIAILVHALQHDAHIPAQSLTLTQELGLPRERLRLRFCACHQQCNARLVVLAHGIMSFGNQQGQPGTLKSNLLQAASCQSIQGEQLSRCTVKTVNLSCI